MNEIIEQYKIVFGIDSKPLEQGVKKAESTFQSFAKVVTGVFASVTVFQSIKSMTTDFANMTVELNNNAQMIGVTAGELQTLGNAFEYFGGNVESTSSSIKALSGHMEQAKRGQGALIEVSRRYGISINPYASATDSLMSLSKQMGRFTTQQRVAIGQQLGLDDAMIRAFADGGKSLEKQIERQKKWGTTTEEDTKIATEFADTQLDLKFIFQSLTRDLARVILPLFTKLVDIFGKFIEWVKENKTFVVTFFAILAVAMLPIIIGFGKMAISSALAFAPLYGIIAVVTAIALVVEDIFGYFMGWDSVTGDLANKFPIFKSILEGLRPLVEGLVKTWESIVSYVSDPSWQGLYDIIKNLGTALLDFFIQPFEKFFGMFNSWWESTKSIGSSIAGWFGGDTKATPNVSQIPEVPQQSSVVNSKQNNINVNNNFNQNITTATPKQFADSTNQNIIGSINNQRQISGAL